MKRNLAAIPATPGAGACPHASFSVANAGLEERLDPNPFSSFRGLEKGFSFRGLEQWLGCVVVDDRSKNLPDLSPSLARDTGHGETRNT